MMFLIDEHKFKLRDGVWFSTDHIPDPDFERQYLEVRKKEGRLYDDVTVTTLPRIARTHPLKNEWAIRAKSADRLIRYFLKKKFTSYLELGCGNGWLTAELADRLTGDFIGMDVNEMELRQAARISRGRKNVHYACGDIFSVSGKASADAIVLAGSVQYFSDLPRLLNHLRSLLTEKGEIHILDSPFYQENEVMPARQRSLDYFGRLGYPGNAAWYFHQKWNELGKFDPELVYDPRTVFQRFRRRVSHASPFPWIRIVKR